MSPPEAREYLDSLINYENHLDCVHRSLFKLERVEGILNRLGSPHKKISFIHIAGTKGKGSTCAFIAFVLREAGYKVGLYTSPHLHDYQERIRILSPPLSSIDPEDPFVGRISDPELAATLKEIKPVLDCVGKNDHWGRLSFFEVLTSLAIYYFQQAQVDFAVLETGLGGRLDATNVVESLVCGLTPISLEHTELLGSTLQEIAQEKAAIIKNKDQGVVVAPQDPQADQIIRDRCHAYQARACCVGEDIRYQAVSQDLKGQTFEIQSPYNGCLKLETRLLGAHQIVNAAVALGVVESLQHRGFPIPREAIQRGMEKTLWPGRLEVMSSHPLVILDGAHNPASVKALVKAIQDLLPGKKVTLIFGLSLDKDKRAVAREFHKVTSKIVFTQAHHPRACPLTPQELEDLFPGCEIITTRNVSDALDCAFSVTTEEQVILISGSLFVVGEARGCLLKNQSLLVP